MLKYPQLPHCYGKVELNGKLQNSGYCFKTGLKCWGLPSLHTSAVIEPNLEASGGLQDFWTAGEVTVKQSLHASARGGVMLEEISGVLLGFQTCYRESWRPEEKEEGKSPVFPDKCKRRDKTEGTGEREGKGSPQLPYCMNGTETEGKWGSFTPLQKLVRYWTQDGVLKTFRTLQGRQQVVNKIS